MTLPLEVRIFLLTSLRRWRQAPLRSFFTLLGVIMGISTFVFGPSLAGSINSSLDRAFNELAGRAQLEIRAEGGIPQDWLALVATVDGIETIAPQIFTGGLLLGQGEPLAILGVDPVHELAIRDYRVAQGAFVQTGTIVLTERYVLEKGLTIGDTLTLIAPGGLRRLTLAGTLANEGVALLNGGDVSVVSLEDAYSLKGSETFDSTALILGAGVNNEAVITALTAILPASAQVGLPQGTSAEVQQLQTILTLIMTLVSGMLVAVGSALVYISMSVAVAERRREIGLLRAVGVSAKTVQALFLVESMAYGIIGTLFGIGLGYALIELTRGVSLVPESFVGNVYTETTIAVSPLLIIVTMIVGVVVPTLAGFIPARRASRIDPLEALQQIKADSDAITISRKRTLLIAAYIVIALGIIFLVPVGKAPFIVLQNLLISVVIAWLMLIPFFFMLLRKPTQTLLYRAFGRVGWITGQSIVNRPRRMIATLTLLTMAAWTGSTISSSTFGYSQFQQSWNSNDNAWDFILSGAGRDPYHPLINLPDTLASQISDDDGVEVVVQEYITEIEFSNQAYGVRVMDIGAYGGAGGNFVWDQGNAESTFHLLRNTDDPAVLVSGAVAALSGVVIGDMLSIPTEDGHLDARVVGLVISALEPFKPAEGTIVMDYALYEQYWGEQAPNRLLVNVSDSADQQNLRRTWLTRYALNGVLVFNATELSERVGSNIQGSSNVANIMSLLFAFIIIAGLMNTVLVIVLDRGREIGLMRAMGLSGRQITWSIVLELVVLAILGAIFGVPLSAVSGYINTISLQRLMGLGLWWQLNEAMIIVVLFIITVGIAAYIPAQSIQRSDVLSALRQE